MSSDDLKPVATSGRKAATLFQAQFDPRIKKYILYSGILLCIATIVGIILLPLWFLFAKTYINRYFDALYCELTTRALHFKKGVWFQTERTIPLDKIQDLTFKEGPVLRYFGLSSLYVETAGQSAQSAADLSLIGIIDAHKFREKVLDQRDEVTDNTYNQYSVNESANNETTALLKEIRDSLKKIEQKID